MISISQPKSNPKSTGVSSKTAIAPNKLKKILLDTTISNKFCLNNHQKSFLILNTTLRRHSKTTKTRSKEKKYSKLNTAV